MKVKMKSVAFFCRTIFKTYFLKISIVITVSMKNNFFLNSIFNSCEYFFRKIFFGNVPGRAFCNHFVFS